MRSHIAGWDFCRSFLAFTVAETVVPGLKAVFPGCAFGANISENLAVLPSGLKLAENALTFVATVIWLFPPVEGVNCSRMSVPSVT